MIVISIRCRLALLLYNNINVCIIQTIILYYIRSTFLGGVKKTRKYRVLEYIQRQTGNMEREREKITLDARIHNGIYYYEYH